MAKVKLNTLIDEAIEKEKEKEKLAEQERKAQEKEMDDFVQEFLNPKETEEEVSEGYEEWLENVKNSENPRLEIFKKLKENFGEEDKKCLDEILRFFESGGRMDILSLEYYLKPKFPNITSTIVFRYLMLLFGTGLIQMEEDNA